MPTRTRTECPAGNAAGRAHAEHRGQDTGPGVTAASRRDLLFGMDLVDTLSAGAGRFLEQGNVTLDRIEVRVFDIVPD